ncbi:MAG: histidine phosphatase family protein [Acidimicrobiales bacterium]|nr:histidine phosphatase family protein [Acidimicrobiales bacterium]MCB9394644.1 histidine phosphatase family protein [Acidimicrobiaceae bacterium]
MTRVHLVRHGRAAAGWDADPDPGLDALGKQQAVDVGARLAPIGPLHVLTSPLLRCQETAAPLLAAWRYPLMIEPRIGEIPSPAGVAMADRGEWLRDAMRGTWTDLGLPFTAYRDAVLAAVRTCRQETVMFSHFVAINVVIGAALGSDALVSRRLDHVSVSTVEVDDDGSIRLVEGGREADTVVR